MKKFLIFGLIVAVLFFVGCKSAEEKAAEEAALQAQENFANQLDLALALEDDLGLEEVIISQDGENLLLRCKAPTIKGEELNNGLVGTFAFINQRVPDEIKTIKLIFTINYVDSAIVEVQREDISSWLDGKISNKEFLNTFNVISLIK